MPKFMTYQRPAPVSRQNWNHAPGHKTETPRKPLEQPKAATHTLSLPKLEQPPRKP
jgi:hypothetical protein